MRGRRVLQPFKTPRRLGLDPEWGRAWLLEVQVWSPDIKKVTERGAPAWSQSKAQQDEQSWSDIQSAIKAHKRKCPAKPKPRAKAKEQSRCGASGQATSGRVMPKPPSSRAGQDRCSGTRQPRSKRSAREVFRTSGSASVRNPCPQQCPRLPFGQRTRHGLCSRCFLV